MTVEELPDVCFLDDLARLFRIHRRTLERLRAAKALPFSELPSLDKRPRYAKAEIRRFLESGQAIRRLRRVG